MTERLILFFRSPDTDAVVARARQAGLYRPGDRGLVLAGQGDLVLIEGSQINLWSDATLALRSLFDLAVVATGSPVQPLVRIIWDVTRWAEWADLPARPTSRAWRWSAWDVPAEGPRFIVGDSQTMERARWITPAKTIEPALRAGIE